MSPRPPDDDPRAASTPETSDDEAVHRLLAEVRHRGPVPPEVAARLDRTLAELAAGSGPDPRDAVVVDLAARRRRRVTGMLVAAVAVVAVGLGINALRGDDGGDAAGAGSADSASSARTDPDDPSSRADPADPSARADSSEESGDVDQGGDAPDLAAPTAPGASPGAEGADGGAGTLSRTGAAVVRPTSFARDARRLRSLPGLRIAEAGRVVGERSLGVGPGFVCSPPTSYGRGTLVPVRYRGGTAVLAYRPPSGETQTVDLLQCGTAQVLRSTTLPR